MILSFIRNKGISRQNGVEILKHNKGGIWLTENDLLPEDDNTNFKEYDSLDLPEQEQIFKQIDILISEKYTFIFSKSSIFLITCSVEEDREYIFVSVRS